MKPRREKALLAGCPQCGVAPLIKCTNVRGEERKSVHRSRLTALPAVAATGNRSSAFYRSDEWRLVRYQALKRSAGTCECCGSRPAPERPLHVDHIRPRSRFPDLALDLSNLQVLCADCNIGKGAWDQTDWRGRGLQS
jgi:5-methylcytosine-specific restriction endonuclease McrA